MPRVPTYDDFQSGANTLSATPFSDNSSQAESIGARQAQDMGRSMQQAGDTASNIAVDMAEQANQVRVNDAVNQLQQARLALTFDPQAGFKNLKGNDALQRPDGKALPDEYGQKLQDQASTIAEGLSNDAQKRMFSLHSSDILTSFKGDVEGHMLGEYRNYALSTQDGTIKTASDTAKLNWNDPDKIAPAVQSAQAAVYQAGKIGGEAAMDTQAKMKATTSAIHMGVMESALQNNNPEYALAYLNQNKDQMTADDLLKARGVINKDVYARVSDGIATKVDDALRMKMQPSDLDRMANITMQTESSGNPNAVGPDVPGQGTAKGSMQVMDATAANPGHGIAPADPNNMDDRARVGRQLLQALTQKYAGDPAKAWAAYDAGEGNVDKALADAAITGNPSNWMSELAKYQSPTNHQQTVDYVNKNVSALESGGGMPSRPTLQDYHDAARAQVTQIYGANPPMGVLKQTLDAATKRFEDTSKALTAQGDNAVLQAQQWIISNNGDFTKLPSDMRTAVTTYSPGKMDDLMKFAKAISRGDNETNMGAYNFAVDHPEQLAQMSPAEFLQFQKTNFSSSDQEKIEKMRANELNGQTDDSSGALNNKAFTAVVNNRLQSIGIPLPTGAKDVDNAQRVGTIKKYLADGIYSQQQQLGRKMVPKEISDYVDGVMSKDVNFQNTFLGFNTGASSQKMLTMTVNDIPTDSLNAIRQGLAARGQPNPSNDTILRSYWTWKNAKR